MTILMMESEEIFVEGLLVYCWWSVGVKKSRKIVLRSMSEMSER